jgi:hypothetical protein
LQASRVDVTVDFQGWLPVPADSGRLITRAKRRAVHHEGFTGFSFGRNEIVARIYDKTEEIRTSEKAWFREIWNSSPRFRESEPVWRLEFQVRRQALRELWVSSGGGESQATRRIESWLDVMDLSRGLWRFLAGKWLTLREPRTNETRQRLAPEWEILLRSGFASPAWEGTDADLYREARAAGAKRTDAAFAGYLSRQIAEDRFLTGRDTTLEEALPLLARRAQQRMARKGTTIENRAAERVRAWTRQRESMAVGNRARTTIDGDPGEADE